MKRILIIFSIASFLIGCNNIPGKHTESSETASTDSCSFSKNIIVSDSPFYSGPYEIEPNFGCYGTALADYNRVPEIEGLEYRSSSAIHIGVRCPSINSVRLWTSGKLKEFADWCICGPSDTIPSAVPLYKTAKSTKDLADHYFHLLSKNPVEHLDPADTTTAIEQFAILLTDICHTEKYCTMQEVTWYDFASCGDNTTRSWFTIDVKTGKELGLEDIVRDNRRTDFEKIILKYLRNHTSFWYDMNKDSLPDPGYLIENMTGCALLEDGIICYYHPYILGCGADGQFNAAIPYSELSGILKIKL